MSGPGIVVVLDGPTQVGRSTTLAGLQRAWPQVRSGPLLAVGLDAALAAFGPSQRRWSELVLPTAPPADAAQPRITWGPLGRQLVTGMHRVAATWARAGMDVGLDHTLFNHATVADLQEALDGLTVLHLRLVCDPEVLEDREREAGSRTRGLAVAQLRAQRDDVHPDLVLDTTEATTEELVEVILDAVAERTRG
ncbi:MAG: phosphotransferase-like protein [Nitriliruptoraceae bacterium]